MGEPIGYPVWMIQTTREQPVDFMIWLNESQVLLSALYVVTDHNIDDSYLRKSKIIVEQQLRHGGGLLASCLEYVFSRAKNIPIAIEPISIKPQVSTSGTVLQSMATVPAEQAAAVVGQTTTVCGKVYSTKFTGKITYINMGGDYPNNPFTAVIMIKNRSNFAYKPEETLPGKTICITGTVQNYKGKPEIVVENEDQIKVL